MKVLVALCAVLACCAGTIVPISWSQPLLAPHSPLVAPAIPAHHAPLDAPPVVYAAQAPIVVRPHALPAVHAPVSPVLYNPAPVVPAHLPAPVIPAHLPAPVVPAHLPAPVVPAHLPAPVVPAALPAPVVHAAPLPAPLPHAIPAPVVPVHGPVTKYHAQDELGQAKYGHSEPTQTHNAVQDAYGNKIGSFSYVDSEGKVVRTDYIADAGGYRVASNNLPVEPAALVHAKAAHLQEVAVAKWRGKRHILTPASTVPLPLAHPLVAPVPVAAPLAVAHAPWPVAPAPVPAVLPAPILHASPLPAHPALVPAALPLAAPLAVPVPHAPAVRPAILTTIVNNPGHAVSYRVD